jgi:Flp pilus assembly protein TadD
VWRDQAAFVAHCASCEPGNAAVQVISGNVHLAAAQAGDASQIEWARRAYTNALTSCSVSGRPAADDLAAKARLGLAWCDLVEQQRRGAVDAASLVLRFRAGLASQSAAPSAWVGIGIAHGLAQQVDEARRAFGNAIELDPRCPEAWFNLGYLQLETGRSAEARASLERSLQCDPDLREAADLLARLR